MNSYLSTAFIAGLLFTSGAVAGSEATEPRTVTVAGEAEVKVVPDEVVVVLGVENTHKALAEVKKANDHRVKNVLAAVQAAGVSSKNVQTDYQMASQNVMQNVGGNASQDGALAPGTLRVRADVSVTFELE